MVTTTVEELLQTIQALSHSEKEQVLEAVRQWLQTEIEIQPLSDLRSQYPNEWLAVVIPEGEDRYDPQRGRLIALNLDKSLVWQQVTELSTDEDVYVFFNGPVVAKGFGIGFHDTEDKPNVRQCRMTLDVPNRSLELEAN